MSSLNLGLGLLNPTDPARLHAELWGDYVSKVVACYVQILLGLFVVARDLFGSSIQCFALDLADVYPIGNTTVANNAHNVSRIAFDNLGAYPRQLAEFVNIYCETKAYFSAEYSIFSNRLFALFLGLQAVILYIPILVWNITTARKIIRNIRFIAHDVEVLYKCWRGEWPENREPYVPNDLKQVVKKWSVSTGLCNRYVLKQVVSLVFTLVFILLYHLYGFVNVKSISREFTCNVKGKFKVDCTIPSAAIYEYVWGFNMALLYLNLIIVSYNGLTCLVVPCCDACKDRPFKKLGVTDENESAHYSFNADDHIMYAFFQANVETIDKLPYIKAICSNARSSLHAQNICHVEYETSV